MKQTDIDLIYENRYYEGNRGMMEEYEDEIQEEVLKKRNSRAVQNKNRVRKGNTGKNRVRNTNRKKAVKRSKSYVAIALATALVIFTFVDFY